VTLTGWALEARVYAEDPFRNFLPSIGRLAHYQPPVETDSVRVDSGIVEGSEVSMFYDPMIAKLVTYGENREQAIDRMADALDAYYIRGVNHNISFLNALIAHPRFREGRLTTNFIAEEYPDGFHASDVPQADPLIPVAIAAIAHRIISSRALEISGQTRRFELQDRDDWVVVANGVQYPVIVTRVAHGFEVAHNNAIYRVVTDWRIGMQVVEAEINGRDIAMQLDRTGAGYRLYHRGAAIDALVLSPTGAALTEHMIEREPPDLSKFLLSPMPGLLVRLTVAEGDEVKSGEELAAVEAMKMENSLRATENVTIAKVLVAEGDSLEVDQPILEFE
ncbi:MAG: biotin/lipoyl-containing protein, partial [Pseudomonadota bacterium]